MGTKKKIICVLSVLAAIVLFCLWYTRPMTLYQFCPGLDDNGTWAMAATYTARDTHPDGKVDTNLNVLALQVDDPAVPELFRILEIQTYRRSLRSLLPRLDSQSVTITNDNYWRVQMADGHSSLVLDTATGDIDLRFHRADGHETELYCTVEGQEAFQRAVYEWLMKNTPEND